MDSGMVRLKESVATKEEVKKQPLQKAIAHNTDRL